MGNEIVEGEEKLIECFGGETWRKGRKCYMLGGRIILKYVLTKWGVMPLAVPDQFGL
jgi:hypothetical protein